MKKPKKQKPKKPNTTITIKKDEIQGLFFSPDGGSVSYSCTEEYILERTLLPSSRHDVAYEFVAYNWPDQREESFLPQVRAPKLGKRVGIATIK